MTLWALPALVLVAGSAVFAFRLRAAAKALRARTGRILADPLEPPGPYPSVVSEPASHVRTVFAGEALGPPLAWSQARDVRLEVTDLELLIGGEASTHLPLPRIEDATLIGSFEGAAARQGGALLRIAWQRGGEKLWSVFAFRRWHDAEKVRKELHLRLHRPGSAP